MSTIHEWSELLPRSEILTHLLTTPVGRVGFVVDGQPYVFPVNFVADLGTVVFRTSDTGLLSRVSGRVAFEVDGYDRQLRAGWSVHIVGTVREITHAADAESVRLRHLNPVPWAGGSRGRWFAITAIELSGRRVVGRVIDEWFAGVPAS